jgi:hypothetical protein
MTFLAVVEGDGGGWRIDRDAPTDAIRARWSEVEIDSVHRSEVRSLVRQFETENGPGEAYQPEAAGWRTRTAWTSLVIPVGALR